MLFPQEPNDCSARQFCNFIMSQLKYGADKFSVIILNRRVHGLSIEDSAAVLNRLILCLEGRRSDRVRHMLVLSVAWLDAI